MADDAVFILGTTNKLFFKERSEMTTECFLNILNSHLRAGTSGLEKANFSSAASGLCKLYTTMRIPRDPA